jgi:ParB family transcriptional regulator, chromosome partitioning protein
MGQFEGLKDFDVAALGRNASASTGKPRDLPVARIERDPDNIRKSFDEAAVIQLAETIKADGLLQAITVRRNIHKKDYFIISYGERRFRAVCLLGHPTIAAVIDDNFDPYRQAIENLQREELDPLDIADWVEKREALGDSRITIAKRLGKPKSYISEIALLIKAPPAIREAFRSRRIPDIRSAYLLARRYEEDPAGVTTWLNGDSPITRQIVTRALGKSNSSHSATPGSAPQAPPRRGADTWNSLAVQVSGREGTMVLKPGHRANQATIQFADGSQEAVALSKIRLKTWMAL